jgi:hypothetical protein
VFCIFAVENVRCSNVKGIDLLLLDRVFQIVIGVGVYAVALAQFAVLLRLPGDERSEFGILRVLKRRTAVCAICPSPTTA